MSDEESRRHESSKLFKNELAEIYEEAVNDILCERCRVLALCPDPDICKACKKVREAKGDIPRTHNIKNKKDRISVVLTRQRDRLQTLYDWNTVGLEDHEVVALSDLITQMNRLIAVMNQ